MIGPCPRQHALRLSLVPGAVRRSASSSSWAPFARRLAAPRSALAYYLELARRALRQRPSLAAPRRFHAAVNETFGPNYMPLGHSNVFKKRIVGHIATPARLLWLLVRLSYNLVVICIAGMRVNG
jgi:hypothetical protein